jgi:hypothetical protein
MARFAVSRKDWKASKEQLSTGPRGSLESRIEMRPRCDDTSTHSPLPTLRLALRQEIPRSPESIFDIIWAFYVMYH